MAWITYFPYVFFGALMLGWLWLTLHLGHLVSNPPRCKACEARNEIEARRELRDKMQANEDWGIVSDASVSAAKNLL